MTRTRPAVPPSMLEHAHWVRGLAARLAHDTHEAEDLAQETWLAFLRAPLDGVRAPRGFLGGILRHRWRVLRRSERRRGEREARAAREELAPSAAEALERAEVARVLMELVLALEEPFRSAILLRYGEELAPRAIAARLGVPLGTVESRLRRGLARLRARWRARFGAEGERAFALLAPLALRAPPPAAAGSAWPLSLGVLLVNTKLVVGVVVLALGSGALCLWSARSHAPERSASAAPELARPRVELAAVPFEPAPARDGTPARQLVTGETSLAAADVPAGLRTLRGRVLDPEARPLAGVALAFDDGGERTWTARSAPDGAFELAVPLRGGEVRAADPAFETLVAARVQGASELELLVVVAPHRRLGGRVLDGELHPLPRARVSLVLPVGFMGRFASVLDAAQNREWTAVADADGRFELARAPVVEGASVVAELDGFAPGRLAAPTAEVLALELVLTRPEASRTTLAGRVLDGEHRPLAGAWVSLGGPAARTDEAGEFRLERGADSTARTFVAVHAGHRPARFEAGLGAAGTPLFPAWIELVLAGEPLALAGRIVDQDGEPRGNVHVWLADPTPFGELADETHAAVEFLLAQGARARGEFEQAGWSAATTDDDGRFLLPGLLEREYGLVLYDERRLERLTAGSFAAGRDDLRLVFPRGTLAPLAGRLVSSRGTPLAGVLVQLEGETYGGVWKRGGEATSDADGRFRFAEVGDASLALWLRGEGVLPLWYAVPEHASGELEVVLARRCNAKVELGDQARADAFRVLDAGGAPLELSEIGASGVTRRPEMGLVEGRSVTFGVSEAASILVLEKGGREVERLALALAAERLNVIGP